MKMSCGKQMIGKPYKGLKSVNDQKKPMKASKKGY